MPPRSPGPRDPRFAFRTNVGQTQFDPRGYTRPFQAGTFPGEDQLERAAKKIGLRPPQIADLYDQLSAHNLPPQLTQSAWIVAIQANDVPTLIIPKNVRRQSWILALSDFVTKWYWSFDSPIATNLATSPFIGIPQQAPAVFGESNGSVSINDIYAWTHGGTPPLYFVGFEGQLSIAGNPR